MNNSISAAIKIFVSKYRFYLAMAAVIAAIAAIALYLNTQPFATDETIGDIAYDVCAKFGYTVYIQEAGEYVPYLVLTNSYGRKGNVLLLRQYVMDEDRPYQSEQGLPNYPTSDIDHYLNTEFLTLFEPEFSDKIRTSTIPVIPNLGDSNWKDGDPLLVHIQRKAFLLSIEEMDIKNWFDPVKDKSGDYVVEGEALKYYKDSWRKDLPRVAYKMGEEDPTAWWLRTPFPTIASSMQAALYYIGRTSITTNSFRGVRPAFCVDESMEIAKTNDIVPGKTVYFLSNI